MNTEEKLRDLLHGHQETAPAPWRRLTFRLRTQEDPESGLTHTQDVSFSGVRVADHEGLGAIHILYATPRGYVVVAHDAKRVCTYVKRATLRQLSEFYPNLVAAALQSQGD